MILPGEMLYDGRDSLDSSRRMGGCRSTGRRPCRMLLNGRDTPSHHALKIREVSPIEADESNGDELACDGRLRQEETVTRVGHIQQR